jgi:hypothetical protein
VIQVPYGGGPKGLVAVVVMLVVVVVVVRWRRVRLVVDGHLVGHASVGRGGGNSARPQTGTETGESDLIRSDPGSSEQQPNRHAMTSMLPVLWVLFPFVKGVCCGRKGTTGMCQTIAK